MLLPCDLRDWLPAEHLIHFILDAVEQIPTAHFRINHRGTGSEQYPPTMMLALLVYCYATGRFGSRTIEAATHSDVAVRYLCANHHPDHDSICTFRTTNRDAFQAAFGTVLQLTRELRLTRVGTVSVDGTKVQANASKHAAASSIAGSGLGLNGLRSDGCSRSRTRSSWSTPRTSGRTRRSMSSSTRRDTTWFRV